MSDASHRSREEDAEFERARVLLDRTVQFLTRCMENPQAALDSEDPRLLIQGLKALSAAAPDQDQPAEDPASEPQSIPIRRRRSA